MDQFLSPVLRKRLHLLARLNEKDPSRGFPPDDVRRCVDIFKELVGTERDLYMTFLKDMHEDLLKSMLFSITADVLEQFEHDHDGGDIMNVVLLMLKYIQQNTSDEFWICTPSLNQSTLGVGK